MFNNQNQLNQLDQQLQKAAKNHKGAEKAIKTAEKTLKAAYQTKFQALRQLSDDSRENQQNRADGGAKLQTYELLNATVRKAEAEILQFETELKQAKQNLVDAKNELDQAKKDFATAYRDFAESKFGELEKVITKASEINNELRKYGGTAWIHLHFTPVMSHGRGTNPELTSILTPGRNALQTLKRKTA